MIDDEFIEAFEATAIPREEWSHEAHVRMGWIYCQREHTCEDATKKVRAGIWALNKANNTPGKLYHETVTIAFMHLIWARSQGLPSTWPEFLAENRDLIASDPPVLSQYYSRELLESDQARLGFVEPDSEPLPT